MWKEGFDRRQDPFGQDYYWYSGKFYNFEPDDETTDEWAMKNNYAAIVPIKTDLTEYNIMNTLKEWNI